MLSPPLDLKENPLSVDSLAAETERGSDSLTALPKKLDRYAKAHERAVAMADYIRSVPHRTEYANKVVTDLTECSAYLCFRHYFTEQKAKLIAARTCKKHLLCPLCAIRRGSKMLARYQERFNLVMQENPHLVPWMVTLTVKNGPDLAERYAHLHKSVRAMNKNRTRGDRGHEIMKAQGSVWSYEFKRGAGSRIWHPHMHGVWLCSSPLDVEKLRQEWLDITGDSFIIDAHPMYGDPMEAFCEVFKYAVKFGGLPLEDNLHAFEVLKGKRLVRSAGLLWGVQVPESEIDDELEDDQWVDLVYRYFDDPCMYQQIGVFRKSPTLAGSQLAA